MIVKPVLRIAFLALGAAPTAARAQTRDTVLYEIQFPNAIHHEARITATFSGLPAGPLEMRMSRSSPGRYALHEFAKNLYSVSATDGGGRPLTLTRPDPYGWNAAGHDGTVKVTYTLFADRGDGTYAGVDRSHAHLNMPATFMWAHGLQKRPIRVTFRPPPGSNWRVATQLAPTREPFTFTAPDMDYFMDSPTEVSDFKLREWPVTSNGKTYTIRLTVHDPGSEADVDGFAEMAKKVVAEEAAAYGEFPDYDFGTYTFVACYGPQASGDGMEHRNSTSITSTSTLARNSAGLLNTLSHEYFHSWNMERIRSAAIEPFDFERANMSGELWFGEGFTQYYTSLIIRRAGLSDDNAYIRGLSGTINAVVNGTGRMYNSPVEMSRLAPFTDAAVSIDPTNLSNVFISYYTWGAAIALGLDMTLRTRFDMTLDDYMRAMWQKHGKPFRPYTLDDLRTVLGELTGDRAFADDFFARYASGRDVVDYTALLANAGVLVRKANPGKASLGQAFLQVQNGRVVVARGTAVGTPWYEAGLDAGDQIVMLDGNTIGATDQIAEISGRHGPGDTVPIRFVSRGRTIDASITFAEDARLEVVPYESAGMQLTDAMRRFRAGWLGSRVR
jgi:predicted metalloprotease with PDZ domain